MAYMRIPFAAAAVALLLCQGCTPYAARVAATCGQLGYDRGTPEFRDCMHEQMMADQQNAAMWSGVTAAGLNMMAQPAPRPWTAQCTSWNGMTQCSGY